LDTRQSSLDIYAFIKIYEKDLKGAFLKKVYDLGSGKFVFQISGENKDHRFLYVDLKKGIFFLDAERPSEASSLAMMLRKQVSERRIVGIRQPNFDRIVILELSFGQELIFEMFRDGNLVLTQDGKIDFALYPREWKNRKVIRGEPYIPPSSVDPLSLGNDNLSEILSRSKGGLVQTLATRLNLGGELAEEVVFRAGLPKDSMVYDPSSMERLRNVLRECLDESTNNVAYEYESPLLLTPVMMRHIESKPREIVEFNDAMVSFLKEHSIDEEKLESSVSRRIKSMEKSIEEFQKRSERSRSQGEVMRSNLSALDKIILFIRRKANENLSLPIVMDGINITEVNTATKHFKVSIRETEFELDFRKTAGQNMNDLFQDSKTYKGKIEGAIRAIESSRKEADKKPKQKQKVRPKEWYEVYHWFRSSEGFLVISGRDAKSNEKIVKKHLKEKDLYVHADVYGAPSTIIKVDGDTVPSENTIREACAFAVSFSRAWSAGLRSGSAYWVLPSQVSKTPESGEFVSTGSWIVRGKRNYLFNLNMELEVGKEEFKGSERAIIRPAEGNWESHEGFFRITPGKTKRLDTVAELSKLLSIPKEELESVLPPGGSVIEEFKKVYS
jgi:predicted ribosome quality control (RQC) complex YloA/Tae2 family protein